MSDFTVTDDDTIVSQESHALLVLEELLRLQGPEQWSIRIRPLSPGNLVVFVHNDPIHQVACRAEGVTVADAINDLINQFPEEKVNEVRHRLFHQPR